MDGKVDRSKKHWFLHNQKSWGKKLDYISSEEGNGMTDFYRNLGTVKIKEE